ncbi:WD40 repeat-like protein [Dichomitus squalens]|uniref:WD40 repeat-like protein n=1 Tax=Dichomitus squalens TaxID=114155 RepID=A0A4Q9NV83_9APHY|nr:WD40 repeat-like protein [Dichomitus squalens]TBU60435.1 WD40 repeat-like protein [Dichomitus squalens]
MSFKKGALYPANPATARGQPTKLSSSKDKIVYTNGRSVFIRDLSDPAVSIAYSGHVHNATVARIAPSGYYCASADVVGNVRIWDTLGDEQTLKGEYKVITGQVKDLEWDGESKRIVAVGDGRDKFGHAFMFDTGSSTGEIIGHAKTINAVSIRQQRPFRAATAADDATIVFHQGVPFKYDKTIKTHTKFVQDVRYASSGDHFASVGSDYKIFVYDGKTGDTLGEFTDSPHTGSVMSVSWSPDSKSLVTSAADGTVKLWDVETKKAQITWTLGSGVNHQQVGNTWTAGDHIVSLSISGDLNVFDKRIGDKPARILYGPQKAITSAIKAPSSDATFIVGTADGRVLSFANEYEYVGGDAHASLVAGLSASPSGTVHSVGFDDRLREIDGKVYTPASFSTAAQPKAGVAVSGDSTVFVAEVESVEAVRSNQKVFDLPLKYTPSAIAASGSQVAVGGEDQKVRLYSWDGKALSEKATLEGNKGTVSALAFSPDGKHLASGDSSGKIALFDAAAHKLVTSRWSFHSGRINSLSWTADGKHCASGSLDTHVYVWSVEKPMKNIAIKNASPGGVNAVFWLKDGELASAGADGSVRVWNVTFHA